MNDTWRPTATGVRSAHDRVTWHGLVGALTKGLEITLTIAVGVLFPIAVWTVPDLVPADCRVQLTALVAAGWILMAWVSVVQRQDAREEEAQATAEQQRIQDLARQYDHTAGMVDTPVGRGKYVAYDPARRIVWVEFDYRYLVEVDGRDCWPVREEAHAAHEASA